jgi:hypothetical protein
MLANIGAEEIIRHQRQWFFGEEVGLAQIITIAAPEVTTIAGRLGKDLKIADGCGHIGWSIKREMPDGSIPEIVQRVDH